MGINSRRFVLTRIQHVKFLNKAYTFENKSGIFEKYILLINSFMCISLEYVLRVRVAVFWGCLVTHFT